MDFRNKLERLVKMVEFGIECIKAGMDIWIDPPNPLKLEVNKNFGKRRQNGEMFSEEDLSRMRTLLPTTRKRIHVTVWHKYEGEPGEYCVKEVIAIDLDSKRLDYGESSQYLFGKQRPGEGVIALFILTLPFTIPFSPYIFFMMSHYRELEEKHGMSRHSHALLHALKGKIDKETEGQLTLAMQNSWLDEQARKRRVTLQEAKGILSGYKLRKQTITENKGTEVMEQFAWYNDKDEVVAHGIFRDLAKEHHVRVLGSRFLDKEADILVNFFSSKEESSCDADRDMD